MHNPLIDRLGLEPHPEGGWFRRTWAAADTLETPGGTRPAATLIEFFLDGGEQSAWHLVDSDEIWLWHGPGDLVLQFGGRGDHPVSTNDQVLCADAPQVIVPGGTWQRTLPASAAVLVSCLVSPGFSFDDWRLD